MSAAVQGVNRPPQLRMGERAPGQPPYVMKPPHLKSASKKTEKTDAASQGNHNKMKEESPTKTPTKN